ACCRTETRARRLLSRRCTHPPSSMSEPSITAVLAKAQHVHAESQALLAMLSPKADLARHLATCRETVRRSRQLLASIDAWEWATSAPPLPGGHGKAPPPEIQVSAAARLNGRGGGRGRSCR